VNFCVPAHKFTLPPCEWSLYFLSPDEYDSFRGQNWGRILLCSRLQAKPDEELVQIYYSALNFQNVVLATGKVAANIFGKDRFNQVRTQTHICPNKIHHLPSLPTCLWWHLIYYSANENKILNFAPLWRCMGDWSVVSCVLNLSTTWRWVVSFMPCPLYAWREPLVPIALEAGWVLLRRETTLLLQEL
jgi:hypothetical protein